MKWWKKFFDSDFYLYLLQRSENEILKETDFLIQVLDLKAGEKLFDQCCGLGDISIGLARKGIQCLGIDQAKDYIAMAKQNAKKEKLKCDFKVKDGFKYVPKGKFDAAINRYTSFGYSQNHEDNLNMLRCAYDSLKKGGKFVLEYYNTYYIENNFQKIIKFNNKVGDKILDVQKLSNLNKEENIISSCWTYSYDGEVWKIYYGQSRFYSPEDLRQMFEEIGFNDIKIYGSMDLEDLDKDSKRCILMGVRF